MLKENKIKVSKAVMIAIPLAFAVAPLYTKSSKEEKMFMSISFGLVGLVLALGISGGLTMINYNSKKNDEQSR